MASRILIVDDEAPVRNLLGRVLHNEGYSVYVAVNGQEALNSVKQQKPDMMILDLNLPDLSGEDICNKVRKDPEIQAIPILILTGRSTAGLSTQCLNGGADAYLSKPFDIKELVAHVRALLRRPRVYASDDAVIQRGGVAIHVAERQVLVNGRPVKDMAPKEFALLKQLLLHSPRVLDKNTLALNAWGTPADSLHRRTLDVHVRRIRQKIGPAAARCLKTVPAIGYQWFQPPKRSTR